MYSTVFFDLDGTLTDPYEGITKSVRYALKKFGIEVKDRQQLKKFIGPPLYKSFMEYYGLSEENALKAVDYYRERFSVKGLYENKVYGGIEDVLKELKVRNKTLVIATSKPQGFSETILKHFGLFKYFDFVAGASLTSDRVEKSDVVRYALMLCGAKPQDVLMVGDREFDVLGAAVNNIETLGVLYGYGSKKELLSAGAKYIAKSPEDILEFII